jgi:hypothetical protein
VRTTRARVLVLLLLLAAAVAAAACRREPPSTAAPGAAAVAATLEPAEIRIGETARLRVVVDHPAAAKPELPEIAQGRTVVVRERQEKTVPLADGQARTTYEIALTSFEPGDHPLGAGTVRFAGAGTAALERPFPAATLRTKSVLAGENTPLREIKGLARWPLPLLRWVLFAAGALLLAAAVFFGVRWWRARRRAAPVPAAPPTPPHETARRALAALRAKRFVEQRQVEPFYLELSAIVRRYIEERFGLRAPERTTEEFIREATGSGLLAAAHQGLVREFLVQCDLVKFARHRPLPADMAEAFAAAERLVEETKAAP